MSEYHINIQLVAPCPYVARSASDKTDDWPFWYVAGGDSRTNAVRFNGRLFAPREVAEYVAAALQEAQP